MYLQEIPKGILPGQRVKIKYDCNGGFKMCGKESSPLYKVAKKNADAHGGKHICRSCQMRANNPAKRKEVQEKIKKTCLERYGAETAMNTEENIEKRRKLFEDPEFKAEWLEKHRQTSLERYGVEHPMQTEEAKENQKATMQEKYGVDYPYQSPEIMEKMRAKNRKKYGVENVASLPEVQVKMAQTTLERYGVERYNQLPEMQDYLREHCREWLAESWANPWAKGITRPEEWNQKQRETVAKLIQSGNWNGGFKSNCRGRYFAKKCRSKKSPRFLSSLELKMHFFLDNNPSVEWYDYECFSIPYIKKEGTNHLYFPDFLVKFYNNPREHIIETKTWKEKDSINVQIKQEAGIDYANEYGMTYTIMFDEDVDKLVGVDLDFIKSLPQVRLS